MNICLLCWQTAVEGHRSYSMLAIGIVTRWIEGEPDVVLFADQYKKWEFRACFPKSAMIGFYSAVMAISGMQGADNRQYRSRIFVFTNRIGRYYVRTVALSVAVV